MDDTNEDTGGNMSVVGPVETHRPSGLDRLDRVRRHWPLCQLGLDALLWVGIVDLVSRANNDNPGGAAVRADQPVVTSVAIAAFVLTASLVGLYRRRFRYGSFDEVSALFVAVMVAAGGVLAVETIAGAARPWLITVEVSLVAVAALGGVRYVGRRLIEQFSRPSPNAQAVLIYGAGNAGGQLVVSLRNNPRSPYRPVGFVDDAPNKRNLQVRGVRVLGSGADLAAVAAASGVELVVLAIPSADARTTTELARRVRAAGLPVRTLPSLAELGDDGISGHQIRHIDEVDLLGRRQVDTDLDAIAGYITGRKVLVTGAGGSIGSELCRQLWRFTPAHLVMLDRDESALHSVQMSIEGRALLDSRDLVVADIRDADRMHEVFTEHRPDVVFHAAALKHLPLLEMHPEEGIKSNVFGTLNVLNAARAVGAARFVNISTDKAANPTSILGHTKRLAERLTAHAAYETCRPYLSVRFGNVLGSRGSVVPAFKAMIEAGGPVTVTDPDVTRYFMSIPEAVQLVIQAGAIGGPGEVLILDMGTPVRIADVAVRLIEASGRPIEIIYTGLRPGEKLHEDLIDLSEIGRAHTHPLVTHTVGVPISEQDLDTAISSFAPRKAAASTSHLRMPIDRQLSELRSPK